MRKLLIGLACIAAIAAIGVPLARYLSPEQSLRRAIEHDGSALMGAAVRVDRVIISPGGRGVELRGLAIGNPAGFATPTAIAAPSIQITLDTPAPGRDAIRIRSLSVARPQFTYEGSASDSNFAKLLGNVRSEAGKAAASGNRFAVELLSFHAAKVSYRAPAEPGRMITVDLQPVIRLTRIGRTAGGATPSELATAILETLIYHVRRKIPPDALRR